MFKTNLKKIMIKPQTTDFFITCKESRIENNTSFYGCFYLGPFDDSLTQTLANDLRRTLLSELTGFAITSVEIEGVLHKFSNLPGMKESVLDLICNLQSVVLKKESFSAASRVMHEGPISASVNMISDPMTPSGLGVTGGTKKTYSGFLNVSGPRIIMAKDLKLPAGLQCVDPNQYIVTLAEDGFLNMKFNINQGKNYIKQKPYNLDVNILKKRNILLQKFKQNISPAVTVAKKIKEYRFSSNVESNSSVNSGPFGSHFVQTNPIPLDAVFMPITKINCVIEENNLYSDFATDISNKSLADSVEFNSSESGQTTIKENLSSSENLRSLLNRNRFIPSLVNDLSLFHSMNLSNSSDSSLTNSNIKNSKLIPWQENTLYFDIVNLVRPASSTLLSTLSPSSSLEVKNKNQKAVKPNSNLISSSSKVSSGKNEKSDDGIKNIKFQPSRENLSARSRSRLEFGNLGSKSRIKNFLASNKVTSFNLIESPQKNADSWLGFKLLAHNNILKTPFMREILNQKHISSFKLNAIDGVKECAKKLEYTNFLKLKPLQKKYNLVVEIWTNGSIHPRQALFDAFSFLSNNFLKLQAVKLFGSTFNSEVAYSNFKYSVFNNDIRNSVGSNLFSVPRITLLNEGNSTSKVSFLPEGKTQESKSINNTFPLPIISDSINTSVKTKSLEAPVEILQLTNISTYISLKRAGIFTLKDLIQYKKKDLLKILYSFEIKKTQEEKEREEVKSQLEMTKGKSLNPSKLRIGDLFLIERNLSYLGLTLKNL